MAWQSLRRISPSSVKGDLHAALAGRPALFDLGSDGSSLMNLSAVESAAASNQAYLLQVLSSVRLDIRSPRNVAKSGGAFYAGKSRPLVAEWYAQDSPPFIFDTRRGSDLHARLRDVLAPFPPAPLKSWSRSPIASLGFCGQVEATASADVAGLSFHHHERNWFYLLAGWKRWYFCIGAKPQTLLERVGEAELRRREESAFLSQASDQRSDGMELFFHEQHPGECVLIPDGVWHCTYNTRYADLDSECLATESRHAVQGSCIAIGVGGMGACASDMQFFAAEGDLGALVDASPETVGAESEMLARIAVEQTQCEVLRWLLQQNARLITARYQDGATLLHHAAGAGSSALVKLLLEHGGDANVRDSAGSTPAHWAALSGSPEVLEVLARRGADLAATDSQSSCSPLHYLAGNGHLDAVHVAVGSLGADLSAKDNNGMLPEDWASANQQEEVAAWLRSQRQSFRIKQSLRFSLYIAGICSVGALLACPGSKIPDG